jgi:hypothetical protein
MGGVQLSIFMPVIGKAKKAEIVSTHLSDIQDVPKFINYHLQREVKNLVSKFLTTKQNAFSAYFESQRIENLNALSALRHSYSVWASNDFTQHLKGEILPFIDVLRTGNRNSRFYQFDKDVFDFCSAIANMSIVNVNYLV